MASLYQRQSFIWTWVKKRSLSDNSFVYKCGQTDGCPDKTNYLGSKSNAARWHFRKLVLKKIMTSKGFLFNIQGEETGKYRKRRGQLAQKDSRPIQPSGPVQPVSIWLKYFFSSFQWVVWYCLKGCQFQREGGSYNWSFATNIQIRSLTSSVHI